MPEMTRRQLLDAGLVAAAGGALGTSGPLRRGSSAASLPPSSTTATTATGSAATTAVTTASAATAATTPAWVGAGSFVHIYDPTPGGGAQQYINDHCFIKGADGTWHLYGITGPFGSPGNEVNFAHATAPALAGPWTRQPYALSVDSSYDGETQIWAPTVVANNGMYYMFYAGVRSNGFAMTLATSTDLFNWSRLPSGPLFIGLVCRDPFVTRINNQWVMYYCELAGSGSNHIVAYRTSSDLIHWSAQQVAFTDLATDANSVSVTESPTVVAMNGWYYLFTGPRNGYVGTDVFASQNPFSFTPSQYAGHVPAHAAELVNDAGIWQISAAGWFEHGVYLAPLHWQTAVPPWQTRQNPALGLDMAGHLHMFALDPSTSQILHRAQISAAANTWAAWETFSDPVGAVPTVGRNADGRLEVFALGVGGANLTHRAQNADGSWGSWSSFGGAAGAPPVVGINADGRMEVFALGPDYAYIAHCWQTAPNGAWSSWDGSFGGPAGTVPAVQRDGRGLLNVLAITPSGTQVTSRTQTAPSGGWAAWTGYVQAFTDAPPLLAPGQDGRLEAFRIPVGGLQILHRWQNNNSDGTWSAEEVFANFAVSCTPNAVMDAGGLLHVFAVRPDGSVWERVQTAPSGSWGTWAQFGTQAVATPPAGSAT